MILALLVTMLTQSVQPISNFNGSSPQFGPMGEPVAAEFYSTTSSKAASIYANQNNFRGAFQIDSNTSLVTMTLVNEGDYEAAVVISGIKQTDDIAKNYLVQIPAFSDLDIDVSELKDYTIVYVTSMTPFHMFFDHAIDQDGQRTAELIVLPPGDFEEDVHLRVGVMVEEES